MKCLVGLCDEAGLWVFRRRDTLGMFNSVAWRHKGKWVWIESRDGSKEQSRGGRSIIEWSHYLYCAQLLPNCLVFEKPIAETALSAQDEPCPFEERLLICHAPIFSRTYIHAILLPIICHQQTPKQAFYLDLNPKVNFFLTLNPQTLLFTTQNHTSFSIQGGSRLVLLRRVILVLTDKVVWGITGFLEVGGQSIDGIMLCILFMKNR